MNMRVFCSQVKWFNIEPKAMQTENMRIICCGSKLGVLNIKYSSLSILISSHHPGALNLIIVAQTPTNIYDP